MAYLLDANVFISAKNMHYGFDFCPAFWDWIIESSTAGKVMSIEKVGDEVLGVGDDLAEWAKARGRAFFLPVEASAIPALAKVSAWANQPRYDPSAISTFLQAADYYLVAQALAGGHIVVTHEVPAPDARKKIKIPDACIGLGVKYVTPYVMLRRERARFVLDPDAAST